MSSLNYEQDLFIDADALDLEWLGQPLLMLKYTEASAAARREVDRKKEELSLTRAELGRKIRKDPDVYGIAKVTNDAVEVLVLTDKKYKKIQDELIDAQYEQTMMQGAVQAVDQRKQALESMTKLLGLQYFAGPKTPRDLPYEVQKNQEKKRANTTIKIKRKK